MRNRRALRVTAMCLLLALMASCGAQSQTQDPEPVPATESPAPPTPAQTDAGEPTLIDFSNGNFDFLRAYTSTPSDPEVKLSLITADGVTAVRAEVIGGGAPSIAVDATSLLGERVSELHEMLVVVGVERADGEFHAVSGTVTALSGESRAESSDPWSVYLPTKNPNTLHAVLDNGEEFVPDAYNMFIIKKTVDNAVDRGDPQSNLVIYSVSFLDVNGNPITVNADATFNAPDGFGELDMSNLEPVDNERLLPGGEGTSAGWGQAVALLTAKNGGALDATELTPKSVITVYYSSQTPPELILQSWTDGAPGESGWAKVPPTAVNGSNSIAQYAYRDLISSFGTDDLAAYLDQLYVGDTGNDLTVVAVTIGEAPDLPATN